MKQRLFLGALACALVSPLVAGDYLTNTNQSIQFLRNPSRDASIGTDGVYYNPAGTAFLKDGFHFQFNWQTVHQHRDARVSYGDLFKYNFTNPSTETDGSKVYPGRVNVPIQPSLHGIYKKGAWSYQFGFGIIGGGGSCEFKQGVAAFEALVGSKALSTLGKDFGGYSADCYVKGSSFDFGITLAAARRISDKLSVSAGLRAVYAMNNYTGHLTDMKFRMANGMVVDKSVSPALADLSLDCDQTGFGVAPVFGIDYRPNKYLNFAAKLEMRTHLTVSSDADNSDSFNEMAARQPSFSGFLNGAKTSIDLPTLLAVGVQVVPIEPLRLNLGYHHYLDTDTRQWSSDLVGNTNEVTLGAEYDVCKFLEVSAGMQKTIYDQKDANISDMSFTLDSYSFGFGVGARVSRNIKVNLAYFQTNYTDHTVTTDQSVATYSRKNAVVGIGVDVEF